MMIRPFVVVCLLIVSSWHGIAMAETSLDWAADGSLNQAIRQVGQGYLDSDPGVGLSIGVVENGRIHKYHFGTTDKSANRPPNDATVYEVGSIAKTFAGLLLARAVLDGKVKLEDPIDRYVGGEYPNLAYDGEPVRIVHLANMTSGLPNNLPDGADSTHLPNADGADSAPPQSQEAVAKRNFLQALHAVEMTERPGINPTHSNAAADLLRYVLESTYDDSCDVLVERYIEGPLKMHSGASIDGRPLAKGYDSQGEEVPPDAGPRYNLLDMLKYAAHQLDEGDEAVALSHRSTWDTLDKQQSIGFFWITSKVDGGRSLRYSGGTDGFSSFCGLYPERKLGIVLLANNASATAQDRLQAAAEKIAEAIGNAPGGR